MFRLLLVMFPPISGMSIFGGICFVIFDPHLHSLSLFQWFNGKWYSKNSPLSIDAKDFIRSLFHSHSWSSNHHFHSLLPRGSASSLWSRSPFSLPFSPSVLRAPFCFCCSVPSSRSLWVLPSSLPIPWDTSLVPSNSWLRLSLLSCRVARLPTSGL